MMPTKDNLQDIVQELYDTDPYIRRKIAQQVMKVSTATTDNLRKRQSTQPAALKAAR